MSTLSSLARRLSRGLPSSAAPPAVEECLATGTLLLEQAGIETARLDVECLLGEVLAWPRWRVPLEPRHRLTAAEFAAFLRLLERREGREPLAYLLGRREFWSLPLRVAPGVLIPRPETETLVEAALAAVRAEGDLAPTIVELCTGSGAVAIALATELPDARLLATDLSWQALRLARANAEGCGVGVRIRFARGNLWRALTGIVQPGSVDLALANPPYIASALLPDLMPEVQWEPRRALDGGPDGLDLVREILAGAPRWLRPGGRLLLEIGSGQAQATGRLVGAQAELEPAGVVRDLAGWERVVVVRRRPVD